MGREGERNVAKKERRKEKNVHVANMRVETRSEARRQA